MKLDEAQTVQEHQSENEWKISRYRGRTNPPSPLEKIIGQTSRDVTVVFAGSAIYFQSLISAVLSVAFK